MAEFLRSVPKPWKKMHARSARALLRAEGTTLKAMRETLRTVVDRVVRHMSMGRTMERAQAMAAIQQASAMLAVGFEDDLRMGRQLARREAIAQLLRELELADRQLVRAGVPSNGLMRVEAIPPSESPEDSLRAHLAAQSLGTAWAAAALAKTMQGVGSDTPEAIQQAADASDWRLKRTATNEVATAFSDESDEGVGWVSEQRQAGPWVGALFRLWNGLLDRRICSTCLGHDGEIVVVGQSFDSGDKPGFVHLGCRCTPSLVFLPWRLTHTTPGHYTGLDDEDEAA